MKMILSVLLLILTSSVFADEGCLAITKSKLCIQLEWTQGPYLGTYSENVVKFKDLKVSSETQVKYRSPEESVQFFAWMIMSSHEHGSRPVVTKLLEDGIYENTKIYYIRGMMGVWQFKVKIGQEEFVLHSLNV